MDERQLQLMAADEVLKEIEAGDIPEAAGAVLEIRASVFAKNFEANISKIMGLPPAA